VKISEKIRYFLHNHSRNISNRRARAWNGVSIMIFRDDHASHPFRIRINYYVLFFFFLIGIIIPFMTLSLYISRNLSTKNPSLQLEGRKLILMNLKYMTLEKKEFLVTIQDQVVAFGNNFDTENSDLLVELTERYTDSNGNESAAKDALGQDILEIKKIHALSEIFLNKTAFHSLNQIWNRISIYDRTPRGRPLGAGIGHITSGYGYRPDPFRGGNEGNYHMGVDFAAAPDTPIIATGPGIVIQAISNNNFGYGKNVRIHHGMGYTTLYAHCSKINVEPGERIKRGQVIGFLGKTGHATGHHVHYEVQFGNSEAIDPMEFIKIK